LAPIEINIFIIYKFKKLSPEIPFLSCFEGILKSVEREKKGFFFISKASLDFSSVGHDGTNSSLEQKE